MPALDPLTIVIVVVILAFIIVSIGTSLIFLKLYSNTVKFTQELQRYEAERLRREFGDIILNHLNEYIAKTLPNSQELAQRIVTQANTITDTVLEKTAKELEETISQKLAGLNQNLTKTLEQTQAEIERNKLELQQQLKADIVTYQKQRIESFDKEVNNLIEGIAGDILQHEIDIKEHTEFIKKQLTNALEYYER